QPRKKARPLLPRLGSRKCATAPSPNKPAEPEESEADRQAWEYFRQCGEIRKLIANIAALKQKIAEREAKDAAAEAALAVLKAAQRKDWLCFMPRTAGSPDFLRRSCDYLENFRNRIEAAGHKVWLNKDHDFVTRVFVITRFFFATGEVWCAGDFTN